MATNPNITHFPAPQTLPAQGRPLARKLAQVLLNIHRVPKNGRNEFHKYDYVYESDLVDHIRNKLAEQGIAIFPSVTAHTVEEIKDARNRTAYLTTVTLEVSLIDGESGDMVTTTWVGQGLDNGDKGYYKAYTGAIKYFLLKTFLISTGDDPENDDAPHELGSAAAPAPKKPAARRATEVAEAQAEPAAPAQASASSGDEDEARVRWQERVSEFRALLEESVEPADAKAFRDLYIERMGAKELEEIDAKRISAMSRKLRGMNPKARKDFVLDIIQSVEA